MGRQPCCDKIGLKRGPWSMDEDQKLMNFILNNGIQCWRLVPKLAGLMRCGKSCRLRWINYLRPDLKRGSFTETEENMIIQLHSRFGNRWSKIASHFPGRTDNEIKNHWNTRIKKKLKDLGLDSVTNNLTPKQLISQDEKEYKPSNSTGNQGKGTKTIDTDSRDDNSDGISKGGASEFGPSESSNYFYNTETWPPSEVSLGTSAEVFDDYYQPWIHSPKNMLPWDNFSIFDEILFYIPQNLDGTNV